MKHKRKTAHAKTETAHSPDLVVSVGGFFGAPPMAPRQTQAPAPPPEGAPSMGAPPAPPAATAS